MTEKANLFFAEVVALREVEIDRSDRTFEHIVDELRNGFRECTLTSDRGCVDAQAA